MSTIRELWTQDVEDFDFTNLTDTDLEARRSKYTKISDSKYELHQMLETLRRKWGLDNMSEAGDRVLRIELAHMIDSYTVQFTHEDYNVAYTIPPLEWIHDQEYEHTELVDIDEIDTSDRTIGISTPDVVYEMTQKALETSSYNTITEIVRSGTRRLLGK